MGFECLSSWHDGDAWRHRISDENPALWIDGKRGERTHAGNEKGGNTLKADKIFQGEAEIVVGGDWDLHVCLRAGLRAISNDAVLCFRSVWKLLKVIAKISHLHPSEHRIELLVQASA